MASLAAIGELSAYATELASAVEGIKKGAEGAYDVLSDTISGIGSISRKLFGIARYNNMSLHYLNCQFVWYSMVDFMYLVEMFRNIEYFNKVSRRYALDCIRKYEHDKSSIDYINPLLRFPDGLILANPLIYGPRYFNDLVFALNISDSVIEMYTSRGIDPSREFYDHLKLFIEGLDQCVFDRDLYESRFKLIWAKS